jgi:Flp pilus assembly protein TadG
MRADNGNIALLFAIMLLPMLCTLAAAIDYSRDVRARAQMQAALDSTALMLMKDVSSGAITPAQVPTKAASYFAGNFTNKETLVSSVTATYTPPKGNNPLSIQVNGSGTINTYFMNAFGFPTLPVTGSSTTTVGLNRLRIALVLDNTGSMNDYNKIGALKTAATSLVDQLSGLAQNPGDVYISVVPFAVDVNVGTANVGASWLRWDRWDPSIGPISGITWCNDNGWTDTLAQCQDHGYTWKDKKVDTSNHSLWNGCVTDRDHNYDVISDPPNPGNNSTLLIVDQDRYCPAAPLLPLTTDWSAVKNEINGMSPSGGTNQPIGLQWGWFSLLQQLPLQAPAENPTANYEHIIILFTDGLNSVDRWSGDYQDPSPQVDARMQLLCDNIKAGGVTIYAVQIDTDGAGQSAVLPYCASDSSKFFMLTQASQIAGVFQEIGSSISTSMLRIAK